MNIDYILEKQEFSKEEIVFLLNTQEEDAKKLLDKSLQKKLTCIGNHVHLRGLVEYSNICRKNCNYCGLRSANKDVKRYVVSDTEVLQCAEIALKLGYGSMALQSGEQQSPEFTRKIANLVREIKRISNGKLGITLSCGEQSEDTYKQWFEAGAHRYLLRIESSNEDLFYKIHPKNEKHSFSQRLKCIDSLLKIGYQTGSGCMIGLPFQSIENLAEDLLFFKEKDIAMVGMGPFIPHPDTPLWKYKDDIPTPKDRLTLTLKMIAILRLMMPEINMVAATADQTLDTKGREKAILAGANVIMPNLTPTELRENYLIYPDKASVKDSSEQCKDCLEEKIKSINHQILYDAWGDSVAFTKKHSC